MPCLHPAYRAGSQQCGLNTQLRLSSQPAVSAGASAVPGSKLSEYDGVPVSALVDAATGAITIVPRASHAARLAAGVFDAAEAAWGLFNDSSYLQTGWAKLEIHTNPNMTDVVCASAAGVLEGKITAHRIYQSAMNGAGSELSSFYSPPFSLAFWPTLRSLFSLRRARTGDEAICGHDRLLQGQR